MFELIGSVLTGGATGIIGTVISGITEHVKQKQKDQSNLNRLRAERETEVAVAEAKEQVRVRAQMQAAQEATRMAEAERDTAEAELRKQSIQSDRATYSHKDSPTLLIVVDAVRGFVRPVLTVLLVAFTAMVYLTTDDPGIQKQIVATVLYITTAATLWWFGTRTKPPV